VIKIIAVSESVKKYLRLIGVPSEKAVVIYNGVDLDEFVSVNTNYSIESYSTILFIGRLLPNKGLKMLIEAARIISTKSSKK
jgi:alpha-maltose-1-phosphate synthase